MSSWCRKSQVPALQLATQLSRIIGCHLHLCSCGFSLVYVGHQWRSFESFPFTPASQSVYLHPQPLHLVTAPQPMHTFCRQEHPCCLFPTSGKMHPPSGPALSSGLCCARIVAPVVCHHHCWEVLPPSAEFLHKLCMNSVICTLSCPPGLAVI